MGMGELDGVQSCSTLILNFFFKLMLSHPPSTHVCVPNSGQPIHARKRDKVVSAMSKNRAKSTFSSSQSRSDTHLAYIPYADEALTLVPSLLPPRSPFVPGHVSKITYHANNNNTHTDKYRNIDQTRGMTMGRIGDGDVHAAYVEFRAKESDKVGRSTSAYSPSLPPHLSNIIITQNNTQPCTHATRTHENSSCSAFRRNASTATPSAQKTPPASVNTSSNATTTSTP